MANYEPYQKLKTGVRVQVWEPIYWTHGRHGTVVHMTDSGTVLINLDRNSKLSTDDFQYFSCFASELRPSYSLFRLMLENIWNTIQTTARKLRLKDTP